MLFQVGITRGWQIRNGPWILAEFSPLICLVETVEFHYFRTTQRSLAALLLGFIRRSSGLAVIGPSPISE